MKVALVGPVYPYRGGIAHYTTMLYRALRERGHDVLMVSFKRQYPRWLYPGRSDKDPSKQPLIVEDAKYWIDSLNPFTWLTTLWRIWCYQPDVIVLQWWTTFWAPVWFVFGILNYLFLKRPLLYICHNVLPHEMHWWDSWLAQKALQWGTQFIVQSEREKKRLIALMPKARVSIVPHPIYDMFTNQKISKEEARKRLGLPLDAPVLLFFGIIRKYKGLKSILTAMPEIRNRLGKVTLLVAGECWEDTRYYLEMIKKLGIGDSVIIENRYIPNEEVGLYFSAADVLIAPYEEFTGSGVVRMAQGFGIPVLPAFFLAQRNPPEDQALDPHSLADEVIRFFSGNQEESMTIAIEGLYVSPSWDQIVNVIIDSFRGVQE